MVRRAIRWKCTSSPPEISAFTTRESGSFILLEAVKKVRKWASLVIPNALGIDWDKALPLVFTLNNHNNGANNLTRSCFYVILKLTNNTL